MNGRQCDIAIVGGGLSGGLIAAAIARQRPELKLLLVDTHDALGGNHRWSWFASDLSAEGAALLAPFEKAEWNNGYDVIFPRRRRTLETGYRSLASADFDAGLRQMLPPEAIRTGRQVVTMDAGGVILGNGEHLRASRVIDCRGLTAPAELTGGWQLFLGQHLRMAKPHGVERPIIMDAAVKQHGAYRFVYLLPLSDRELFVEDTYYADSPSLDRGLLTERIASYCADRGWDAEEIASEAGVLPVVTGGDFDAFQAERRIEGVACAGLRGGFFHPLTSYSLPQAVETALTIARHADLSGAELARMLEERAREHWRATGFYRMLGQMLFGAARPDERWRIFQRFYGLPQGVIERFYAAESTMLDRARVLIGKPPVSIGRALAALAKPGEPMAEQSAA